VEPSDVDGLLDCDALMIRWWQSY